MLLRGHDQIAARVLKTSPNLIWVSSITVEEMLKGSINVINSERSRPKVGIGVAHIRLVNLVKALAKFNLLPYDDNSEVVFKGFTAREKRVGTQDCRIAAIAISQNFTVVTCNRKDFSQISRVKFEDWSIGDPLV